MKKIDVKKPRYALPIICLPFLLLFFYVYKNSFGKPVGIIQGKDSLQVDVAGVSQSVKEQELSGKLDAFRNKFKQADGYTAVGSIGEEVRPRIEITSAYNLKEKQMLDSIDQVMKTRYGKSKSSENIAYSHFSGENRQRNPLMTSQSDQDRALSIALAKIKQGSKAQAEHYNTTQTADPMQLFRAQMALVDSMGKANDPAYIEKKEKEKLAKATENDLRNRKNIAVKRALGSTSGFNTILSVDSQRPISAIVDQDITGFSGSRLRIRLTDDIMAGKVLIRKGTYLYATISGFSAQRVSLNISSVFNGGEILPVNLQVYDNDGLAGIYVPASAFREFTRDLGSSGSQGVTIQQMAENNNQLVMGVLSKMFQSTTSAVNKLIRSNKVKIKYNTQVYLIDTDELKRKQQSY